MNEGVQTPIEERLGEILDTAPRIKIVGVGGAGGNMVDWLYSMKIKGAELIAVNTDAAHLKIVNADKKILIGKEITRGLGAGGDPRIGAEAARASVSEIKKALEDSDMVWFLGGLGGGTATGALPVFAKIAKEMGIPLVIAVVTLPFKMEGNVKMEKAEHALLQLREYADNIIVIDNQKLLQLAGSLPLKQAFAFANNMIGQMLKGIVETITITSMVNLDYADIKTVMSRGGVSVVGIGESNSENRAIEAVKRALENPLLEVSYEGAKGAIVHAAGGEDMTLQEVNEIGEYVSKFLGPDSYITWGARIDPAMKGTIRVTVIVTGVKSPYILGKERTEEEKVGRVTLDKELGIEFVHW